MTRRETRPVTPVEYAEVVPAQVWADIEPDRRITSGRLLQVISHELALPLDYAGQEDLQRATPKVLQGGLYIMPRDPRYKTAELRSGDVVFPSYEYPIVTRSARDLAVTTSARVRKANRDLADRDELERKAMHGAAEALNGKLLSMTRLHDHLEARRTMLRSLGNDLQSTWTAHFKAKNLDKRREEADQAIHETAEVACVNLGLDTVAIEGLHRAIKLHLYRQDENPVLQRVRWQQYIVMTGRHTRAKQERLATQLRFSQKEFERYEPYMDAAGA